MSFDITLIYVWLIIYYAIAYSLNGFTRIYLMCAWMSLLFVWIGFKLIFPKEEKPKYIESLKENLIIQSIKKIPINKNVYLKSSNGTSENPLYFSWNYGGEYDMGNYYNISLNSNKNEQSKFNLKNNDIEFLRPLYRKFFRFDKSSDYIFDKTYNLNKIEFLTNEFNKNLDEFLELEKCNDNENEYMLKTRKRYQSAIYSYLYIGKDNKLQFDPKDIEFNIARFTLEEK